MKHWGAFHPRAWAALCVATSLPLTAAWAGASKPATPVPMPTMPAAASLPVATMPPVKSAVPGVTGPGFNLVELLQELKGNKGLLIWMTGQ